MINLNATKVSRERVEIELSTEELFLAANKNLSNKQIANIMKNRLKNEIVNIAIDFDPELQHKELLDGRVELPVAYVKVCLDSGNITKTYYPDHQNADTPIITKISPEHKEAVSILNKLAKMKDKNEY